MKENYNEIFLLMTIVKINYNMIWNNSNIKKAITDNKAIIDSSV